MNTAYQHEQESAEDYWARRQAREARTVPYFLLAEVSPRLIKIGRTSDLKHRMRKFEKESPAPVELLCTVPGDSELHHFFREYRHHGEWFVYSPEIERLVAYARKYFDLPLTEDWSSVVRPPAFLRIAEVAA